MLRRIVASGAMLCLSAVAAVGQVYLNIDRISVAVGAGTSAGSFNNSFDNGATIDKVIDAPSADALEYHDQATHIWWTAAQPDGELELHFDFGGVYDISMLHFWNYTAEDHDVDLIEFSFYDQGGKFVDALVIQPALGSAPGIGAQDIPLPAPLNIRYVTARLSGSNREVDFQNIGFTATVSKIPLDPDAPPLERGPGGPSILTTM